VTGYEQKTDADAASGADETERERRMDVRAERESEMEAHWGATGVTLDGSEPPPTTRLTSEDYAALLDESDLSDATQARPEDVGPCPVVESLLPSLPLLTPPAPPELERRDAYVISNEEGLRRAFSAIRHARRRLAQNERMQRPEVEALERELATLKEANTKANAAQLQAIERYENAISVYAQTHRKEVLGSETPRKGEPKTRDYGIGRISYRASGGEYRWRQDMTPKEAKEALAQWALRQHSAMDPDDERILVAEEKRYVPDRDAIEEYVETLEGFVVPDGLEWVPEGEVVTVKTEEK
jgi:hypothetical protein